jgi:hypothetical protein
LVLKENAISKQHQLWVSAQVPSMQMQNLGYIRFELYRARTKLFATETKSDYRKTRPSLKQSENLSTQGNGLYNCRFNKEEPRFC